MAARSSAPRTSPIPVKLVMMAASAWVWKMAAVARSMTASCRSSSSMVWASRAMTEAAAASPEIATVCRPAASAAAAASWAAPRIRRFSNQRASRA